MYQKLDNKSKIFFIILFVLFIVLLGFFIYKIANKKEKDKEKEKEVPKKSEKWNFIKNKNIQIMKDSNDYEYIECNILINTKSNKKYSYIGVYDFIASDEEEGKYFPLPPVPLPTSIKNLETIGDELRDFIFHVNLDFRITYIPGKGYKIYSIVRPHIRDPTSLYELGYFKQEPSNKLQDISNYLIDILYLQNKDRMKYVMKTEKQPLFWDFEQKDNKFYIKTKNQNKSLSVVKEMHIGLVDNTEYDIKIEPTFPLSFV